MDMNKEKWINEVMNSLDDVKSAEVNPFLFNRILNKVNQAANETVSMKLVWLAAASFALLIFLNIRLIKSEKAEQTSESNQTETLSGYQLLNENSVNYN